MLPFIALLTFYFWWVAGAIAVGLAMLGAYWSLRIIEVLMIRSRFPADSAGSEKSSSAFDGLRAYGRSVFKSRGIILILIGMICVFCGGIVELGFADWHRTWEDAEAPPMNLFETVSCFLCGGLIFGTPPAILGMIMLEISFRLLKKFETD